MIEYKSKLVRLVVAISDEDTQVMAYQLQKNHDPREFKRLQLDLSDEYEGSAYDFLDVKNWSDTSDVSENDELWYIEGYHSGVEPENEDEEEALYESKAADSKFEITLREPLNLKTYIKHWVIPFALKDHQMMLLMATDCLQAFAALTHALSQLWESENPAAKTFAYVLSALVKRAIKTKSGMTSLDFCSIYIDKTPNEEDGYDNKNDNT